MAKDVEDLSEEARVAEIRGRIKTLTPRETEVFALVVTGMLNKQIASALGVGEKTVKVHRARSWRRCAPDRWPSWFGSRTAWA